MGMLNIGFRRALVTGSARMLRGALVRRSACMLRGALVLGLLHTGVAHAVTLAHWSLDEGAPGSLATGTATVLDHSGHDLHGTAQGSPAYAVGASGRTGLQLDGSSQFVFVPASPMFSSVSLTVEAVFTLDRLPSAPFGQIVFYGDRRSGMDPFYLAANTDGTLRFVVQDSAVSGQALVSTVALVPGQLTHVAGTIDDATGLMQLFIDGDVVASTTTTARPTLALLAGYSPGLGIGNTQYATDRQYLGAWVDQVRLSDVALSPSEFLVAAAVPEPSALAMWVIGLGSLALRQRWRGAA